MQFGMNLLLWSGGMNDGVLPILDRLKKMGYDGVEVPMFDLDVKAWESWGKKLDNAGLARTAVTVRGTEDNPVSPDAGIRRKGIECNKRTVDCCQAVGATHLAGPYHSALGQFTGCGPTDQEWLWAVEGMQQVAEHAERTSVVLVPEAVNRFECYLVNSHAELARFAREVGSSKCRMMYDTFHANIEEKNVRQAIQSCQDVLAHVHISENDRSTPGKGAIRWSETFDALREVNYDGWLTVEAFGLALPELVAATKIWRRMYDTELQLAEDALRFMKANVQQRWG